MKLFIFLMVAEIAGRMPCGAQTIDAWKNDPKLLAWNQDTVVNYRLGIYSNNRFLYTMEDTIEGLKVVEGYKGIARLSNDTLYLAYEGKTPSQAYPFLRRATGPEGVYFSQQFRGRRKIMYLRVVYPAPSMR